MCGVCVRARVLPTPHKWQTTSIWGEKSKVGGISCSRCSNKKYLEGLQPEVQVLLILARLCVTVLGRSQSTHLLVIVNRVCKYTERSSTKQEHGRTFYTTHTLLRCILTIRPFKKSHPFILTSTYSSLTTCDEIGHTGIGSVSKEGIKTSYALLSALHCIAVLWIRWGWIFLIFSAQGYTDYTACEPGQRLSSHIH